MVVRGNHSQRVVECGRMLIGREKLHTVDSYTTGESNKTRGKNTQLLLSSGEKQVIKLNRKTFMDNINTPITKTKTKNKTKSIL